MLLTLAALFLELAAFVLVAAMLDLEVVIAGFLFIVAAFVFGNGYNRYRGSNNCAVVLVATFALGAATFPLGTAAYYNVF